MLSNDFEAWIRMKSLKPMCLIRKIFDQSNTLVLFVILLFFYVAGQVRDRSTERSKEALVSWVAGPFGSCIKVCPGARRSGENPAGELQDGAPPRYVC